MGSHSSPRFRRLLQLFGVAAIAVACTSEPRPETSLADESSAPQAAPPTTTTANTTTSSATTTSIPAVPLDEPYLVVDAAAAGENGTGSVDNPILRPRDAFDMAEPGTTIYFRAGTYNDIDLGSNIIRNSGTADNWIVLTPYPDEEVTIDAGGEWGNAFAVVGASFIEISGFTMLGRDDSIHGSGVFVKEESHDIRVLNNYMEGFGGAGISLIQSTGLLAENNTVRGNAMRSFFQGSGISIYEPIGPVVENGPSNIIRNNYVVGNYNGVLSREDKLTDGNCIIIDFFNETKYQGSTLVENNTCIDNGGRGIHVFNSSNVVARNNTLIGNVRSDDLNGGKAEMVASAGTDIKFYNNLVINRSGIPGFHVSDGAEAVFGNNMIAEGPLPPGESNVLLADRDVLASISGAESFGFHRPLGSSVVVGAADPAEQSTTDATGVDRPLPGSVGALEPASR